MQKKRTLKITGITIGVLLLALIITVIALLSLGYRFTSKSAAGRALADNPIIKTEEYDFYCINTDLINGSEKLGEVIVMVCPIEKVGFLYKEVKDYESNKVIVKDSANSYAGVLTSFKGKNCYYNFFMRYMLQQELLYNYETVKINGEEKPILNHSYFVTNDKVTGFELADKSLIVLYE